jgi:two-component system OmpR family response regulator
VSRNTLHVLIVEDGRDAADTLAELVRLWGYTATAVYDGLTGYQKACDEVPDCLLLDINMPGMDGYDLARRVRETPGLERVKLIAISAFSHPDHVRRAEEAGFDYRLTKPADLSALERTLRMIDNITRLAEKTQELARENVNLAAQAKELIQEVKEDIREVKQDVKDLKEELKEIKDKVDDRRADE